MASEKEVKEARVQIPVKLRPSVVERMKDAVYWTWPEWTMGTLLEAALEEKLRRLERARGERFLPREGPVPTGRPPGPPKPKRPRGRPRKNPA
jgi:hypothetical protein